MRKSWPIIIREPPWRGPDDFFWKDWRRENGLHLTAEEARQELLRFLPTLKRWKKA